METTLQQESWKRRKKLEKGLVTEDVEAITLNSDPVTETDSPDPTFKLQCMLKSWRETQD